MQDPKHKKHFEACQFVARTLGKDEGFSFRTEIKPIGEGQVGVIYFPVPTEETPEDWSNRVQERAQQRRLEHKQN